LEHEDINNRINDIYKKLNTSVNLDKLKELEHQLNNQLNNQNNPKTISDLEERLNTL